MPLLAMCINEAGPEQLLCKSRCKEVFVLSKKCETFNGMISVPCISKKTVSNTSAPSFRPQGGGLNLPLQQKEQHMPASHHDQLAQFLAGTLLCQQGHSNEQLDVHSDSRFPFQMQQYKSLCGEDCQADRKTGLWSL